MSFLVNKSKSLRHRTLSTKLGVQNLMAYTALSTDEEIHLQEILRSKPNHRCFVIVGIVCAVVGIVLGVLIGWYSHKQTAEDNGVVTGKTASQISLPRLELGRRAVLEQVNKDNLRNKLREFTSKPRLPGSQFSLELAEELATQWKENGLDVVNVPSYTVLLSYPNKTQPNKVEIVYENGTSTGIESAAFEKPLDAEGNNTDVVPPYNAFAPPGIAEGALVYVNYGRIEDFQFLLHNMSMDLKGTIGIARYGKIFRGDKVQIAERFNMSGLIMYTDPSDFNMDENSTYPDSWWMPDTGVQRGTVAYSDGDLLTKFYPAKDYAVRAKLEDVKDEMPGIPAQPISYGDAEKFLSKMKGKEAPESWQGKLKIKYKLGPGYMDTNLKTRLSVHNFLKETPVKNVIGYIKGQEEPDRYVLLGNHHDAWVFGAIDPLSGTTVVTELTRIFGQLLKQGQRPRRTIVFCSWGGEETGLHGSTEWVEEHAKVLYERAIAYLNVDYAVDFTAYPAVGISPLLQDSMYIAAKQVPNPTPSTEFPTMYDIWKNMTAKNSHEPSVYYSLGSGSDMATFYQRVGVPSTDFWYTYDESKWDIMSYPLYHSAYETFHMYTTYIDPSFNYTQGIAHLLGVLTWNLANEMVLPYDVRRYATAVNGFIENLVKEFGSIWTLQNVNIGALQSASSNFTDAAAYFHGQLSSLDNSSDLQCRMINDKMIQLERAFIDPEGLPGRPIYKHMLFAPSQFDGYSDNDFPAIVDMMYEIQTNGRTDLWDSLKQQVYIATYFIQSAAETLLDIGL